MVHAELGLEFVDQTLDALFLVFAGREPLRLLRLFQCAGKITGSGFDSCLGQMSKEMVGKAFDHYLENFHRFSVAFLGLQAAAINIELPSSSDLKSVVPNRLRLVGLPTGLKEVRLRAQILEASLCGQGINDRARFEVVAGGKMLTAPVGPQVDELADSLALRSAADSQIDATSMRPVARLADTISAR